MYVYIHNNIWVLNAQQYNGRISMTLEFLVVPNFVSCCMLYLADHIYPITYILSVLLNALFSAAKFPILATCS